MAPRKRASSDQIRDQAKRNVRPAKNNKSITKGRPEGFLSSSRRSSPGLPATISHGGDDNSELELSSTDVDEENIEPKESDRDHRRKEDGRKGKNKLIKDSHTMALSASRSSLITLVSWFPYVK